MPTNLRNPIQINDLTIGWQNCELLRIDDNEGKTLLALIGRDEIVDVIAALTLSLAFMQRATAAPPATLPAERRN